MTRIPPLPCCADTGRLDLRSYPRARDAFRDLLAATAGRSGGRILLPAYIGHSSREGSGVFDPVAELGLDYGFYPVDRQLRIDRASLLDAAGDERVQAVLLVHWFGYVDAQSPAIAGQLRAMGKWVFEDCAHALLSDRAYGICGNLGDASFYSLHKMLPLQTGGLLRVNNADLARLLDDTSGTEDYVRALAEYDLPHIAQKRRDNASRLADLLRPYRDEFEPLYPWPQPGVVPQTWPVLIHGHARDEYYFRMNERGYGLVSLYHSQIEQIDDALYPSARWVGSRICNLPVHQDIDESGLSAMVAELLKIAGRM